MSPCILYYATLDACFDKPLAELPSAIRDRVGQDFLSFSWDGLSADRRRNVARLLDHEHDPGAKAAQHFWDSYLEDLDSIEQEITEWKAVGTPTASDLELKGSLLAELGEQRARMKIQLRLARGDFLPLSRKSSPGTSDLQMEYLPYPKAMQDLALRSGATPEDLAGWIHLGPETGGLAAYRNVNELNPPPRFLFDLSMGKDYRSQMSTCWFRVSDLAKFEPSAHYLTGKALIKRWTKRLGVPASAFILAKIAECRLTGIHPIYEGALGSVEAALSMLGSGLFALHDVEAIERADFGEDRPIPIDTDNPCKPVFAAQIIQNFRVFASPDKNQEWWKQRMRDAGKYGLAECRAGEGKKGLRNGTLWRPDLVAAWLLDRHDRSLNGLNTDAVRAGLKKFRGCENIADDLFPSDQ